MQDPVEVVHGIVVAHTSGEPAETRRQLIRIATRLATLGQTIASEKLLALAYRYQPQQPCQNCGNASLSGT